MSNIRNLWGGAEMSGEEALAREAVMRERDEELERSKELADALLPELEKSLETMTLKEALETREDDPESCLYDLEKVSMEGVKTVIDRQVERLMFDALARYADGGEAGTADERRRALNNLIQLRNKDSMLMARAELTLAEPSADLDPRVAEMRQKIADRQTDLLREALGSDLARMVDELQAFVAEGWRSEEWQAELEAARSEIKPNDLYDPGRFLASAEHIGNISFDGDEPVALDRIRNIREAEKEFRPDAPGDPAGVANQPNPYLRRAAEIARDGRTDLAVRRGAETLRFLQEKIRRQVTRMGIREA